MYHRINDSYLFPSLWFSILGLRSGEGEWKKIYAVFHFKSNTIWAVKIPSNNGIQTNHLHKQGHDLTKDVEKKFNFPFKGDEIEVILYIVHVSSNQSQFNFLFFTIYSHQHWKQFAYIDYIPKYLQIYLFLGAVHISLNFQMSAKTNKGALLILVRDTTLYSIWHSRWLAFRKRLIKRSLAFI